MLFKTSILAALAALTMASPTPNPEAEARALLEARDNTSGTNIGILTAQTGNNNFTAVGATESIPVYCEQFQPVFPGGFDVKGWAFGGLIVKLFKNANCAGTPAVTISKANGNEVVNAANLGKVLSFQAQFVRT